MRYIFFDTETSGLPISYKAPISNSENWPHIVQLSWIVTEDDEVVKIGDHIIKPEGFVISESVSAIHGITTERAIAEGISLREALSEFLKDFIAADCAVGHNITFDKNMLAAELYRLRVNPKLLNKPTVCTMMSSIDFCELPGPYNNYKWPKLQELYVKLFNEQFEDAHNSMADVEATMKCFFEHKKRNIIHESL